MYTKRNFSFYTFVWIEDIQDRAINALTQLYHILQHTAGKPNNRTSLWKCHTCWKQTLMLWIFDSRSILSIAKNLLHRNNERRKGWMFNHKVSWLYEGWWRVDEYIEKKNQQSSSMLHPNLYKKHSKVKTFDEKHWCVGRRWNMCVSRMQIEFCL